MGILLEFLQMVDPAVFFVIMRLCRFMVTLIDTFILLPIFGKSIQTGTKVDQKRAKENYEQSAQLVQVLGRGSDNYASKHTLENFFYNHLEYVHPRYVLGRDQITLQSITPTEAIFCIAPQGVDVYDTQTAPFAFILQYFTAQQLIIMPLSSFHRLASEIGDPDVKNLVFINMTGRCGSTLMCQMFARIPNCTVMSEPWSLLYIHGYFLNGKLDLKEYTKLIRSVIRLQCKTEPSKTDTSTILMKLSALNGPQFKLIKNLFPQSKMLYMTRHPKASHISLAKVIDSFPTFASTVTRSDRHFWCYHLPIPYGNNELLNLQRSLFPFKYYFQAAPYTLSVAFGCSTMSFLENRRIYDKVYIYEDLMTDAKGKMSDLMKFLGLPEEHLSGALTALKSHSQKNMFDNGNNNDHITEEGWKIVDKTYDEVFKLGFNSSSTLDEFRSVVY